MERITVSASKTYDIIIKDGIIGETGTLLKEIKTGGKVAVIADETTSSLFGAGVKTSLSKEGFEVFEFAIPAGEESKSAENYISLLNGLAENKFSRSDFIVALGGGVVGDLTGFVAATYLRGVSFIQIPTTLLSAVDSSVGGKTGINHPLGKNMIGAFYQPKSVIIDIDCLKTLPQRELSAGMAEVIKYGIIADASLFKMLRDPAYDKANLRKNIEICVAIKRRFVEEDEYDTGIRQMLNFGHTIGHAIEIASDFQISHGFAVAKGMAYIADIAVRENWCDQATRDAIIEILESYHYDLTVDFDKEVLADIMAKDKKRKGSYLDLVVPVSIGSCRLERVPAEKLETLL